MIKDEKKELSRQGAELLNEAIKPYTLSETGVKNFVKTMDKFKFDLALLKEAVEIGKDAYLEIGTDGLVTKNSADLFLSKYGGIMFNLNKQKTDPEWAEMQKLIRYLDSSFGRTKVWVRKKVLDEIEAMRKSGFTIPMVYRVVRGSKRDWDSLHKTLVGATFEEEVLNETK